jgi:hypothetical protein
MYNAQIGRWHTIDPLAGLYTPISPYTYVANDPTNLFDPDGRRIRFRTNNKEQEKKFKEWLAGILGGNENVKVDIRGGYLNLNLKNGGRDMSESQLATTKYLMDIIGRDEDVILDPIPKGSDAGDIVIGENYDTDYIDVGDLDNLAKAKDPLNFMVHMVEERFQKAKKGQKRGEGYDDNHPLAEKKELEILGKTEANNRDDAEVRGAAASAGIMHRFDYVDRNGNYINSREYMTSRGQMVAGRTFNKNDPAEKVKEARFKTSVIVTEKTFKQTQ